MDETNDQARKREAFGRALAAGSDGRPEDAEQHWQPVYVVTAGTDSRAPFTVAVCATQEAAGATALRFERLGVRIDVFSLLT